MCIGADLINSLKKWCKTQIIMCIYTDLINSLKYDVNTYYYVHMCWPHELTKIWRETHIIIHVHKRWPHQVYTIWRKTHMFIITRWCHELNIIWRKPQKESYRSLMQKLASAQYIITSLRIVFTKYYVRTWSARQNMMKNTDQ